AAPGEALMERFAGGAERAADEADAGPGGEGVEQPVDGAWREQPATLLHDFVDQAGDLVGDLRGTPVAETQEHHRPRYLDGERIDDAGGGHHPAKAGRASMPNSFASRSTTLSSSRTFSGARWNGSLARSSFTIVC